MPSMRKQKSALLSDPAQSDPSGDHCHAKKNCHGPRGVTRLFSKESAQRTKRGDVFPYQVRMLDTQLLAGRIVRFKDRIITIKPQHEVERMIKQRTSRKCSVIVVRAEG